MGFLPVQVGTECGGISGFHRFVSDMGSRDEWELAVCRMWTSYFEYARTGRTLLSGGSGVSESPEGVSGFGVASLGVGEESECERGGRGLLGADVRVREVAQGCDISGVGNREAGDTGDEPVVASSGFGVDDAGLNDDVGSKVQSSVIRGKWYEQNRRKRERRRGLKAGLPVPVWRRSAVPVGSCETVLSTGPVRSEQSMCPSYGQALSDAEKEAKQTLARRRAAENKLKEKLALMKIASLEDEKICKEYADLKHHRIVQWTNEAVAKSQQSLEKCKSVDPGSSASQYEIRKQAKDLADLKCDHERLLGFVRAEVDNAEAKIAALKMPGTETMEFYQMEGEMMGEVAEHHEIY